MKKEVGTVAVPFRSSFGSSSFLPSFYLHLHIERDYK